MINESSKSVSFPVMRVTQPIGDFFVGKMSAQELIDISWFDVRKLRSENSLDGYLGIQRKINDNRVREISQYVTLTDATFPTAVILAVESRCAELTPVAGSADNSTFFDMCLKNQPGDFEDESTVLYRGIARVLDGQHRIMGLKESGHDLSDFEINVCVFVGADIADQASIFATVNLAQTKVNASLVYDLLSYSKSRSPERTCHTVTVTLDKLEKSPFNTRIKRLGVATDGRFGEVLTQATIVKSLIPYISNDPLNDRDIGKRFGTWRSGNSYNTERLIFRKWFIEDEDDKIALQMMNYFEAVKRRWPDAWAGSETGDMLPRTNGFKAFMSLLRPAFNHLKNDNEPVKMSSFLKLFEKVDMKDTDFNTKEYLPGSSGERKLYHNLMEQTNLAGYD